MADLFKKLNVLVKSSLNDLIGDATSPRRRVSPERLGSDIDGEVAALRKRINEAVDYESGLQARVRQLETEVAGLDQQADDFVNAQDDVNARYTIEQMKRAQQRLAMAEADLRDHRFVTQELIQRVNTLEAVVADARRAQAANATETEPPIEERGPGRLLSDVLREAREKIASMGDVLVSKDEVSSSAAPAAPADEQTINDDLERRRQRLSK
jgi:phage shock protein A